MYITTTPTTSHHLTRQRRDIKFINPHLHRHRTRHSFATTRHNSSSSVAANWATAPHFLPLNYRRRVLPEPQPVDKWTPARPVFHLDPYPLHALSRPVSLCSFPILPVLPQEKFN
ncbi:hypothetical protein E2C01_055219 [Portunus trituberculatus]|uniref:Uncharacterized protein n=1 Tax=Portunus trituberculatus TaxID=210409 RepID=A0A5B7GUP4_PORTR|nr:hypothetical protein [Portunus trituberculatus]